VAALNLVSAGSRCSGRSAPADVSETPALRLTLEITAVSGHDHGVAISSQQAVTPRAADTSDRPTAFASMELVVETSPTGVDDEGTHWTRLWGTTLYGVGSTRLPPLLADAFVRARWVTRSPTAGVTAAFTFSLTGDAL
jgi:hypothetical protein